MRPIKFRARDTYDEDMVYDINNARADTGYTTLNEFFRDDRWQFMQSTGLTDKNHQEIYEGDILESTRPAKDKYLVVWDEGDAAFYAKDLHFGSLWKIPNNQQCVVIGNIHENLELVDQE